MPYTRAQYATNRDKLLQHIITTLATDKRFVAAWLTGSLGRGEGDALSDIDISIIVAQAHTHDFCGCIEEATTKISSDTRLHFYEQFGQPLVLREDKSFFTNGCFNHVSYRETAVVVDWVFIPQTSAKRPQECCILFDNIGIPTESKHATESLERRTALASRDVGFFWLMTTVTVKYILRHDTIASYGFINTIYWAIQNVKRYITGEEWKYQRVDFPLACTPQEQATLVRQLCQEMLALMPQVAAMGGYVPENPMALIELWLEMVKEIE